MDTKRIHYVFAALSFLVALITYTATMQPTIPFWDCGEFAAAASTLSIPHPPGAPFWSLIGRLGMLIPTFSDPVARYNFLSVLSSAASIWLLYLTIVRLVRMWRGNPKSTADVITHYGGALIGALAYCFTDSFWFNAVECEVYAFGSLFISLIFWLGLVWYDHANEEHGEKYLLLIFYVMGLSLGVHQLALLALFPVFMLVYYKRNPKPDAGSFIWMGAFATLAFVITFKVILSGLVEWAGKGSFGSFIVAVLLIGTIIGIYWSQKNRKALLNISLWCGLMVVLGYSTYSIIMVRAADNPPMNQWQASNFKVLAKYINREQYGEWKALPRRLPEQRRDHEPTWDPNRYSSDFDFFIKYQTNHMFTRYLGWNFIGRQSDVQDAGVDWSKTWGIPMLLGLLGLYWHFRRDPKRAFTLVAAFILLGFLTAWYQNQQDPQPRERDYFYVGAFYIYAMWVGIGATGILEMLRAKFGKGASTGGELMPADGSSQTLAPIEVVQDPNETFPIVTSNAAVGALGGVFVLLLLLVPINQAVGLTGLLTGKSFQESSKWAMYSRHNNFIPYDYAYNILQSCEPNAILFTAGDNDTFPLWCIQDVYGVRRDVRIVNLSLGNMSWYIRQLKHEKPWGTDVIKLPGFPDEQLNAPDDTEQGVHYEVGPPRDISLTVNAATVSRIMGADAPHGDVVMNWKYTGQIQQEGQNIFVVADQLVKDIVMNNINDRPIYFASVVPAYYRTGLDPYTRSEGLASRVVPVRQNVSRNGITTPINEKLFAQQAFTLAKEPSLTPERGMIVRTYNDPTASKSSLDDHYSISYRLMYLGLADYYISKQNLTEAKRALQMMEQLVPIARVPAEGNLGQIISDYFTRVGDQANAAKYLHAAGSDASDISPEERKGMELQRKFNAADQMLTLGQYDSAKAVFQSIMGESKDWADIANLKIRQIDALKLEKTGDKKGAYDKLHQLIQQYGSVFNQQDVPPQLLSIKQAHDRIAKELGIPIDTAKKALAIPDGAKTPANVAPKGGAPAPVKTK